MTTLALRDALAARRWVRWLLACAVALLALSVSLHHSGWMPDMPQPAPASRAPSPAQHATMPMAAHSQHGHHRSNAPQPAPHDGHAMTTAMCLAILGSALLLPAIVWLRRTVARRRDKVRRRPRAVVRPPRALVPKVWFPPPRGGPTTQSLLCVVRR